VVAALAVSQWVERQTGWSIKRFVRTARRYRTVKIKTGTQLLIAADPLPEDLRDALLKIRTDRARRGRSRSKRARPRRDAITRT
jgi:hypothetical protein